MRSLITLFHDDITKLNTSMLIYEYDPEMLWLLPRFIHIDGI